jgi:enoyl-CoA hydratase/carnithine racemase
MSEHVTVELRDHVLVVTWSRPEKKNALTGAMYAAFAEALDRASEDPAVRVVLVTGAGDAFTSGNDLKDFATWGTAGSVEELPVIQAIRRAVAFPKPLVAAVKGAAVGFGTTLLPHCDAVVAGESASFAMPFVRLGLVPEFGSSYLLPAIAGRVVASHKLLLGEPFGTAEAAAMGLVSETCADAELEARAFGVCRRLAALPPGTVRAVKTLMKPVAEVERLSRAIDDEVRLFMAALQSPEHKEAVTAFMEKRQPDFSAFR